MDEIENLLAAYKQRVALPWQAGLSAGERTWLAIYSPQSERRLRRRVVEFRLETLAAGHRWLSIDITDTFAMWLGAERRREDYFRRPSAFLPVLERYEEYLVQYMTNAVAEAGAGPEDLIAVVGAGTLYGLTYVNQVVPHVAECVPGRLLVFFPGRRDGTNYRLLNARDGWNYLAVPITPDG